jgi:hypothetical protein
MNRLPLTHILRILLLVVFTTGSALAQASASLELVPVQGDEHAVVIKAKMVNTGSAGFLLEAVFVTVSYDPSLLTADQNTIGNLRFATAGFDNLSLPLFRAFQPNDEDTTQYGEASPTVGNGVTIPPNAPLDLCTFTFKPKQHPACATFTIIGNMASPAYTGFYVTSQVSSVPFSPGLGLQNFCWTPVEYQTFTAAQQGEMIALRWVTLSETNNYGFFIERRYLEAASSEWETITFVKGKGTTNTDVTYIHFDDDLLGPGTYEYRLLQQDFDGTSKYSPVRSVEYLLGAQNFALHPVYPNPVSLGSAQGAMLRFTITERSEVRLRIQNTLGQVVATPVQETISAGTFTRSWTPRNLPPGMYIGTITSQGVQSGTINTATVRLQVVN